MASFRTRTIRQRVCYQIVQYIVLYYAGDAMTNNYEYRNENVQAVATGTVETAKDAVAENVHASSVAWEKGRTLLRNGRRRGRRVAVRAGEHRLSRSWDRQPAMTGARVATDEVRPQTPAADHCWRNGGATTLLYRRCGDSSRGRRNRPDGPGGDGGGGCSCGRLQACFRVRTAVAARPVVDDHRRSAASSSSVSSSSDGRRRGLMCRQHRSTGCRQVLSVQLVLVVLLMADWCDGGVVRSLLLLLLFDGGGSAPVHLVGRSYNVSCCCCCCVGVLVCRWLQTEKKANELTKIVTKMRL